MKTAKIEPSCAIELSCHTPQEYNLRLDIDIARNMTNDDNRYRIMHGKVEKSFVKILVLFTMAMQFPRSCTSLAHPLIFQVRNQKYKSNIMQYQFRNQFQRIGEQKRLLLCGAKSRSSFGENLTRNMKPEKKSKVNMMNAETYNFISNLDVEKTRQNQQRNSQTYSDSGMQGKQHMNQNLKQELNEVKILILSYVQSEHQSVMETESLQKRLDKLSSIGFSNSKSVQMQAIGMEALQIQLDLNFAVRPSTILSAIRYLCKRPNAKSDILKRSINAKGGNKMKMLTHSLLAYRLLQRLISGVGVAYNCHTKSKDHQAVATIVTLRERDICMVLKALIRSNNCNLAHQLLLLQERIHSVSKTMIDDNNNENHRSIDGIYQAKVFVPAVSAVAYSILIKAYARSKNLSQIESLLARAYKMNIQPDTIFLNSIIDAYINCDAYEKADIVFCSMKRNKFEDIQPNTRTYNTMLKGMAKRADVKGALKLSSEMERLGKHDAVSVNTIVNAMVHAGEFTMAESVLDRYTGLYENAHQNRNQRITSRKQQHPHVEAYTELLDGYAKVSMLSHAFTIFDKMKERNVTPNEITYTCLAYTLGKAFDCARGREVILQQQRINEKEGKRLTAVMYNGYLKGLLCVEHKHDERVNEAFSLLYDMMNNFPRGCKPDAATAVTLVEGVSKSSALRIHETKILVDKIIPELDDKDVMKVQTAMLKAFSRVSLDIHQVDSERIDELFQTVDTIYKSLNYVDVIAMNSYLDACCRLQRFREAFEEFKTGKDSKNRKPDVATYTILISALLSQFRESRKAVHRAQELYREMKKEMRIFPDMALIDVTLSGLTNEGASGLKTEDAEFIMSVLKDARNLDWGGIEEYKKREKIVNKVLVGRFNEVWKLHTADQHAEDEFLKRKGWNEVDSSFRFLGSQSDIKQKDEFLESKGWNDVDSGFRIF